jgi:hypothetical protein
MHKTDARNKCRMIATRNPTRSGGKACCAESLIAMSCPLLAEASDAGAMMLI